MKKKKNRARNGYDVHLYLEDVLWKELEGLAEKEDRSVTATARVLIKEALGARKATAAAEAVWKAGTAREG